MCAEFQPCPVHKPGRRSVRAEWHGLYDGRRYRLCVLRGNPLCVDPYGDHGRRVVAAECVDHVKAHRGDYALFWEPRNHWAPCLACNSKKAALEEGAFGNAPPGG
jgi:5-methylcytosine-specific restriction protein A